MLITQKEYVEFLQHYESYACVVRNADIFYLFCKEREDHPNGNQGRIGVLAYYDDEPDVNKRFEMSELSGFSGMCGDVAYAPKEQLIGASASGRIYVLGGGEERLEDKIESGMDGPRRGVAQNIKTIGDHPYMVTSGRGVCRRVDVNTWESLCPALNLTPDQMPQSAMDEHRLKKQWGFNDIDGFNEDELYAVGGLGDVWYYTQGHWTQCRFPEKVALHNVVCAPTGDVYIAGTRGVLYKGSKHQWERVAPPITQPYFYDMVWYDNTLYATHHYDVYRFNKNTWETPTDLPEAVSTSSGSLSARDGVLLVAGEHGAAFKKDGTWHTLFLRPVCNEWLEDRDE